MRRVFVVGAVLLAHATVHAQTGAPARPAFEVASVKPHSGNEGPRGISFSPSGRFAWNRMTVRQLLQSAYGELGPKEVDGGPGWLSTDAFDIAATSPEALAEMAPDGTPVGLFRRLRTLLEDRFALKAHIESRSRPVYALEPAATPVALGAGLTRVQIDCAAVTREAAAGRREALPYGQQPPCSLSPAPGRVRGRAVSMAQLVGVLEAPAGRPVIDRTGLTGSFDLDLRWAFEFPPGALINGQPAPAATDGPSIFTAVREQLGLKLEASRADVPVLVIDSVSRPTPD
jgi:uncharacterized protein (TIGR03435 family)